jgi:hypothetical protein
MCDIDLKTCEKSSKYKKSDIVALGKKCGVDTKLPNGKEKTRNVICTEISNLYKANPSSSQSSDDDEGSMVTTKDPLCDITEKKCQSLDKIDVMALGEHCGVGIYDSKGKVKPSKSICKSIVKSKSPQIEEMDLNSLKKLAKNLNIDWRNKTINELQYLIKKKINSLKSVTPSPVSSSVSSSESPSVGVQNMKKKDLKELALALGESKKKVDLMDKNELLQYILSRKKTPSPRGRSPSPRGRSPSPRGRSPSPRGRSPSPKPIKYRRADLMGKKVVELKELAKIEGLKKWKDKTPSKMLKKDFIDFLLTIGGSPVQPSKVLVSKQPKDVLTRSELLLLKVPELKKMALSYGLKKFKDKTPSQLRKNDFVDYIISVQKRESPVRSRSKTPPRSPTPVRSRSKTPPRSISRPVVRSRSRSKTPPPYKSEDLMNLESDEEEIVIQKKVPKSPSSSSSPSITVTSRRMVKPDLPVYTGSNAEKDLENLAQSFDYKVVQVKGDGNCLFRSVSKSLKLNLNIKYNHKELRQMVVDYLKNNTEILDLYLEYVTSSGETTPEEHQKNVKKYIKNMAKSGVWGDFICLKVISEILMVKLNLLILNSKQFRIISNDDSFVDVVPLGFIDDYHYTALVPLETQPSVAPSIKPSVVPSVAPSIKPSVVPSVAPSIKPSVVPSVAPSIKPSVVPSVAPSTPSIKPSVVPSIKPSVAPNIPQPVFSKVKPLSSVNELLEIMDKVKPYVYDDISQLKKAEWEIMVSLGM